MPNHDLIRYWAFRTDVICIKSCWTERKWRRSHLMDICSTWTWPEPDVTHDTKIGIKGKLWMKMKIYTFLNFFKLRNPKNLSNDINTREILWKVYHKYHDITFFNQLPEQKEEVLNSTHLYCNIESRSKCMWVSYFY